MDRMRRYFHQIYLAAGAANETELREFQIQFAAKWLTISDERHLFDNRFGRRRRHPLPQKTVSTGTPGVDKGVINKPHCEDGSHR